jgi:CheY-like chemotaxis protein
VAKSEKQVSMKKHIILLVEDDELDIISVQRSLKKIDVSYELHTAFNGKEAMAMLTEQAPYLRPDVILLDLNMPKMNGIEFLRSLRNNDQLKDIKVFIMTTSSESADRTVAEDIGISGFIIKPLSYNDNSKKSDSMDAFVQFHLRKILMNEAE